LEGSDKKCVGGDCKRNKKEPGNRPNQEGMGQERISAREGFGGRLPIEGGIRRCYGENKFRLDINFVLKNEGGKENRGRKHWIGEESFVHNDPGTKVPVRRTTEREEESWLPC